VNAALPASKPSKDQKSSVETRVAPKKKQQQQQEQSTTTNSMSSEQNDSQLRFTTFAGF